MYFWLRFILALQLDLIGMFFELFDRRLPKFLILVNFLILGLIFFANNRLGNFLSLLHYWLLLLFFVPPLDDRLLIRNFLFLLYSKLWLVQFSQERLAGYRYLLGR